MRKTEDVVITDDGHEMKFRVTAMSALGLENWLIKAGLALAKAGLLDIDAGELTGSEVVNSLLDAVRKKGFSFLGGLDAELVQSLLSEIVEKCAQRIDGKAFTRMSPSELDAAFTDIRALMALQRAVFSVNFSFLMDAGSSATRQETPAPTISIPKTSRRRSAS